MATTTQVQDGWGTEEDSNQQPTAQKEEPKAKVMANGFWGDEPASSVVTVAGDSQPNNNNEASTIAWAEESDKQSNKGEAAAASDAPWSSSPMKGGSSFNNDSGAGQDYGSRPPRRDGPPDFSDRECFNCN